MGYSGEFAEFCGDHIQRQGNAVFYRTDKFELIKAKNFELGEEAREKVESERHVGNLQTELTNWSQIFQTVALRFKDSDQYLVIGN